MSDPGDTFFQRMEDLKVLVGDGLLHGEVNVDQVYARYQDGWGDPGDDTGVITPTAISHGPRGKPGPLFDHPHGGEAGYLSMSLTFSGPGYAQRLADAIGEEVPMVTRMIEITEDLAAQVAEKAPIEVGALRGSAGTTVLDNGAVAYIRGPVVPRLSQGALDAIRNLWRGQFRGSGPG